MIQINLRGLTASKYGSATKLATHLGWSGAKTRNIVSGRQAPNLEEAKKLAEALDIHDPKDIVNIFFNQQST